jgi:hypothetical protein
MDPSEVKRFTKDILDKMTNDSLTSEDLSLGLIAINNLLKTFSSLSEPEMIGRYIALPDDVYDINIGLQVYGLDIRSSVNKENLKVLLEVLKRYYAKPKEGLVFNT